jgi:predicted peroxiredoxin
MMKKTIAFFLMPLLFAACIRVDQAPDTSDSDEKPADGVFLHVSKGSDDTHAVEMALMLADKFSTSNDVLLFFDQKGIEMVVKGAPNLEMDPFDGSDEVFDRLLDHDVEILACPACLQAAGYTEDDLRRGVKIAEKEHFFDFTEGRILTLDY